MRAARVTLYQCYSFRVQLIELAEKQSTVFTKIILKKNPPLLKNFRCIQGHLLSTETYKGYEILTYT